jgi:uncharacterized protein YndB with AHSA1/START domain
LSTNALAAIKKSVVVNVSQQRAFEVFTTGIDSWWPRSHHIGESPLEESIIEPRQDGRWYGRSVDGSESPAGRVLVWEPPGRLVLAWQITGEWRYDPDLVTEVEVHFIPEAPDRTRVELEHRNLDRFGKHGAEMRATFTSDGGWTGLLPMFAAAAEGRPVEGREA